MCWNGDRIETIITTAEQRERIIREVREMNWWRPAQILPRQILSALARDTSGLFCHLILPGNGGHLSYLSHIGTTIIQIFILK
jgi:hypothetical protein